MNNKIAKRYMLCFDCSNKILSGKCNGKCKEYWKYIGAIEQKAIDINKACEIVRNIANKYFGDWEQSCKVEDTFRKAMEK